MNPHKEAVIAAVKLDVHAASNAAINFVLDKVEDKYEAVQFLKDWREGSWDEWPEFSGPLPTEDTNVTLIQQLSDSLDAEIAARAADNAAKDAEIERLHQGVLDMRSWIDPSQVPDDVLDKMEALAGDAP